MPNRILRDGILSSEAVCSLSWGAEVFYRRLMSVADDYGRYYATPKLLRSACYPLQIDKVGDKDIASWLNECTSLGLIAVYPADDGKKYIQIIKFNQQVRSKSKFPEPPAINCNQVQSNEHLDEGGGGDVFGGGGGGAISSPAKPDDCPHVQIVELYHEILPELPAVKVWHEKRAKALRARWKEDASRQSLDWWRAFFEDIRDSDFLMGRSRDFQADLEWLIAPTNMPKVLEGKYRNRTSLQKPVSTPQQARSQANESAMRKFLEKRGHAGADDDGKTIDVGGEK